MKTKLRIMPLLAAGFVATGLFAYQDPSVLDLASVNSVLKSVVDGALAIQSPEVAANISAASVTIDERVTNLDASRVALSAGVTVKKSVWSEKSTSLNVDLKGDYKPATSTYFSTIALTLKTQSFKAIKYWLNKGLEQEDGWLGCETATSEAEHAACNHVDLFRDAKNLSELYKWAADQMDLQIAANDATTTSGKETDLLMRAISNSFKLAVLDPSDTFDLQIADLGFKMWDMKFGPLKVKMTPSKLSASLAVSSPVDGETLESIKEMIKSQLLEIQNATVEQKQSMVESFSEYLTQVYEFAINGKPLFN